MNKRIFASVFLASLIAASVAYGAVSSPCGARKPAPKAEPREEKVDLYKRDVIGTKVPIYTDKTGNAMTDKAAGYQDRIISGKQ